MLEPRALLSMLGLVSLGCTGTKPAVAPRADAVKVSEQAPPAGYVPVQILSVQSGKGCGLLAERGSREDAEQQLRNAAAKLGATYVYVTARREPRVNHQCLEHEYQVTGTAYRAPPPPLPAAPHAPNPAAPMPVPSASTSVTLPRVLLDFEGDAPLGKPARATERSSVALSLASGEGGGTALSVQYRCQGEADSQGLLDVWLELARVDVRAAKALSLRVKPDEPIALRVSWAGAGHESRSQISEPLAPGVWQTLTFSLASPELGDLTRLGLSPTACGEGRYLVDEVSLE